MKRTLFYIVILAFIAGGIFFLQKELTGYTSSRTWKIETLTSVPSDDRLRPALLGFDVTLSHILWIKTVLYFGSHYMTDKSYTWLIRMVDIITRLNPYFYPAYEFAGIMIPAVCNNPDAARVILERGFSHLGTRKWNIGFYLGMLYYNYYNEKEIAADYLRMASLTRGAPVQKLVKMASAFYSQAGKSAVGMQLLQLTVESSQNPEVRRYFSQELQNLIQRENDR